jgi:GDP-L-fucose synthase
MSEDLLDAGPPPPSNAAYALSKRALWYGARALQEQYGVPYTALVPSNLYGPRDHFGSDASHFLAAAIDKIERARREGAPHVEFFGTGRALRQFILAEDLARLIVAVIARGPANETLNVACRDVLSIRELAEGVAAAAGYEGEVRFSGKGPDGQYRKDADPSRLGRAFPDWLRIETPFEEGVQRTLAWYREHVATG